MLRMEWTTQQDERALHMEGRKMQECRKCREVVSTSSPQSVNKWVVIEDGFKPKYASTRQVTWS
jgi:hypothetical protein